MCDQAAGVELLNSGAFSEAESHLRFAIAQTAGEKNVHGLQNAEQFMWTRRLAESLIGQGKFEEATRCLKPAIKQLQIKYGPNDEDVLDCKYLLAESLFGEGKRHDADPIAQSILEGLHGNLKRGPDHFTTLKCRALCALYQKKQCKSIAKGLAQSTLEALESVLEQAETRVEAGGRKLMEPELLAAEKVRGFLAQVLDPEADGKAKDSRASSKSSTCVPDSEYAASDFGGSRCPSKA